MSHVQRILVVLVAAPSKVRGRTAVEEAAEHGRVEMIRVLWNAAEGKGFTPQEIEEARNLARSRGHRGCAEYIDGLSSASSFSLLEINIIHGPWDTIRVFAIRIFLYGNSRFVLLSFYDLSHRC